MILILNYPQQKDKIFKSNNQYLGDYVKFVKRIIVIWYVKDFVDWLIIKLACKKIKMKFKRVKTKKKMKRLFKKLKINHK